MRTDKRIVVAGGGLAGHKIAYELQDKAEVTLIDPKDFFEVPMAAPRLFVAPDSLPSMVPYASFLKRTARLRGRLIEVASGRVTVAAADGTTVPAVPYDYLVLATGGDHGSELVKPRGGTIEERRALIRKSHAALRAAERILIIGGGAVGIELAGEIAEDFPGKCVTVVEAGDLILAATSNQPRRWAERLLRQRGVRLLVGERIVAPIAPPDGLDLQAGEAVTDRDKLISYDLAIWCVGTRPDASYLRPHFADALDAAGHIRVEPSLRVVGVPDVFALGDVADFREKGGIWAQFQTKVCVDNLKRLLADPATARLKHYRRPLRATTMVVTLGRKNGVMDLPFGRFRAGWLARAVKGRDMLVTRYRKGIGLVPARKMPDDGPDLEGAS